MIKRFIKKQREVIIVFCEGEAEILLFSFLKLQYSNKKIEFRKPIDLKGFGDLIEFKKLYIKHCRAQELKPKSRFLKVNFLFIFDNDLPDSERIKSFLEDKKHFVQQLEPNIEGLILGLIKKEQGYNLKTKEFRKKCKDNFKSCFDCEAHNLKEKKLKEIFKNEEVFKNILPVLFNLLKK
jgi:hypothetical protein